MGTLIGAAGAMAAVTPVTPFHIYAAPHVGASPAPRAPLVSGALYSAQLISRAPQRCRYAECAEKPSDRLHDRLCLVSPRSLWMCIQLPVYRASIES
jgi:hypothetical protein